MRRLVLLPCLLLLALAAPAAAGAPVPGSTPPTVTTRAASAVGVDSATLHGTVDPNGQPVSYRFEYGTTTAYGLTTADAEAGPGTDPVSVADTIGGLSADTTYHYRVIAWPDTDPTAVVRGADRTFRTLALPTVSTNSARDMRPDGTTLDGKVDPNGSPTTVYFEWGLTQAYGQQTPEIDVGRGSTAVEVQSVLNGLTPNTTYHYRIVATNAVGIKRGRDRGFRTLRAPTGIVLSTPQLRVGFGDTGVIAGQVQGAGVNGIRVGLEASPFPFTAPFASASSVVTAASDGSFRLSTPPLQISTRFRVVTRTSPPVSSPDVTALTELILSATAQRRDRRRELISGRVTPHVTGARVSVQRRVGRKWRAAKRTRTKRLGRGRVGYQVTVLRRRKAQRYRVVVTPRTASYAPTTSETVRVPALARRKR